MAATVVLPTPPFTDSTAMRWQPRSGLWMRRSRSVRAATAAPGPGFQRPPVRSNTVRRHPPSGRCGRGRSTRSEVRPGATALPLQSTSGRGARSARSGRTGTIRLRGGAGGATGAAGVVATHAGGSCGVGDHAAGSDVAAGHAGGTCRSGVPRSCRLSGTARHTADVSISGSAAGSGSWSS